MILKAFETIVSQFKCFVKKFGYFTDYPFYALPHTILLMMKIPPLLKQYTVFSVKA